MGPNFGEVVAILVAMIIPALLIFYFAKRWFTLKEKRVEAEARIAAETSGRHLAHYGQLEQRLATLERIVTDGPLRLSNEIDALAIAHRAAPQKDLA
jgi:hypothetical protein